MKKNIKQYSPCGTIAAGVVADCSTKPVAGTEAKLWLINRADIVSLTPDNSNSLIKKAIVLDSGKSAYPFKGLKNPNTPSTKMNKGKYFNNWIHGLDFLVFANDGATKKIIEDLSNGEVCAVVENKSKGTNGNSAFELLGYDVGLVLTQAERNPNDADTAGAWKLTLGPDEGQFEGHVPLTIFDTDYATTKDMLEALE